MRVGCQTAVNKNRILFLIPVCVNYVSDDIQLSNHCARIIFQWLALLARSVFCFAFLLP